MEARVAQVDGARARDARDVAVRRFAACRVTRPAMRRVGVQVEALVDEVVAVVVHRVADLAAAGGHEAIRLAAVDGAPVLVIEARRARDDEAVAGAALELGVVGLADAPALAAVLGVFEEVAAQIRVVAVDAPVTVVVDPVADLGLRDASGAAHVGGREPELVVRGRRVHVAAAGVVVARGEREGHDEQGSGHRVAAASRWTVRLPATSWASAR